MFLTIIIMPIVIIIIIINGWMFIFHLINFNFFLLKGKSITSSLPFFIRLEYELSKNTYIESIFI